LKSEGRSNTVPVEPPAERPGTFRSPLGLRIRPAAESDLPIIVTLQARCFPTALPKAHLRRELLKNRLAEYFMAELAPDSLVRQVGARSVEPAVGSKGPEDREGEVVGYVAVWWLVDEAHVSAIAVDPAWRRQGVARCLMAALQEEARRRDMASLTLEVRASNTAARQLYAGFGLRPVGRRVAYYTDTGEDALILTVPLGHAPDATDEDLRGNTEVVVD
jgi:ribosomal-protein-alanine N-acetyltransferase